MIPSGETNTLPIIVLDSIETSFPIFEVARLRWFINLSFISFALLDIPRFYIILRKIIIITHRQNNHQKTSDTANNNISVY